ncbi:MAG: acyl-CoA dehydrogenase family protein [Acidimicrobiales bacterium]
MSTTTSDPGPEAAPPSAIGESDMDISGVKEAIADLLPTVRAYAGDAERARRLAGEVVGALRPTGINRLLLPVELGGMDAPVVDTMDIVEQLATADGSTAWCAVIGTGSNLFAGYLPPEGARRVFADRDQGNATMLAPAGTLTEHGHGHRLSGRWPFTSNCLHSEWIGLGAFHADDGGAPPALRVVFVPAAEVRIEDTWESSGLRATGSHHVAVDDAAVDREHCCIFNGDRWADGRLWRIPIVTTYLPLLASVPLGIARGALDEVARLAMEGRPARRGQVADDPTALHELGTADARLRAARAGLHEAVGEAHVLADRRAPIDRSLQARVCLAAQEAVDLAVEATSTAHQISGGDAAYRGNRQLRALDDVLAARQHLLFSHQHRHQLATALVGIDRAYPPFVI